MSDTIRLLTEIDAVPAAAWDAMVPHGYPFLLHGFLGALERHGCVGPRFGWLPRHLLLERDGRPIAAMPLYLKDNSYGEFVFDHGWADAYRRHGRDYYPKLVAAIPYTPATGPRLLHAPDVDGAACRAALVAAAGELAHELGVSSAHVLFHGETQDDAFAQAGWLERSGVQFHWRNRGYAGFDDFLAALNARRRKQIRRERRRVADSGAGVRLLPGDAVSATEWALFARLYTHTFEAHYSLPTLNAAFFAEIGRTLGPRVLLALADHRGETIAGALFLQSDDTLYGRHWGALRELDCLHFETCFYRGLDHCIDAGLARFEPGAQGEHKIWRGFLPTPTRSRHWIADPAMRGAIDLFLARERRAIADYRQTLDGHSPFRDGAGTASGPSVAAKQRPAPARPVRGGPRSSP